MNCRAKRFPLIASLLLGAAPLCGLTVSGVLLAPDARADEAAQQSPDALVKKVANDLLNELDKNRAALKKDPAGVRRLVDTYLLPYFDTEYAARLVLGKYWRDATPDQRKRFIDGFYKSLLDNYGNALLDFTSQNVEILPYHGDPGSADAVVKTTIKRSNGQAVPVNYSLHKVASGWKAWDVTIEGISYVRSFKNDFGGEIERNGIDAVIKKLESGESPVVGPQSQKKNPA
jgi:phospholipid transport system substrate-binding protein